MLDPVPLFHRHRIDFGAKHDRRSIFPALEDRRQACATESGNQMIRMMSFHECSEDSSCLVLLTTKLCVCVEISPQGDQRGQTR